MAAKLKVDQIESVDGSSNITLNQSVTMASGKTIPAASLTGTLPALDGSSLTGTGKLLQIKRAAATGMTGGSRTTSGDSTFSGNMGNTHCSVDITPTSTTSMFVVLATAGSGTGGNDTGHAGIYRGTGSGSVCLNFQSTNGYSADATGVSMTASYIPGNTTEVTISLRAIGCWGGNTMHLGSRRSGNATAPYGDITVMEIEV